MAVVFTQWTGPGPESSFSFHACVCLLQRVCYSFPTSRCSPFLVWSTTSPLLSTPTPSPPPQSRGEPCNVCLIRRKTSARQGGLHQCGLFKTWLCIWLYLIWRHLVLDSGAQTLGVRVLFHWRLLTEYKKRLFVPILHLIHPFTSRTTKGANQSLLLSPPFLARPSARRHCFATFPFPLTFQLAGLPPSLSPSQFRG